MAIVAGIDEAGFGPTLGPLVVSGVAFRVPDDQVDRCLWEALHQTCTKQPKHAGRKLVIADSKKVYRPKAGFAGLERAVLVTLASAGVRPKRWRDLLDVVAPGATQVLEKYPWYAKTGIELPVFPLAGDIPTQANAFRRDALQQGIVFQGAYVEPLTAGAYNRMVQNTRNKAVVLLGMALRVADRIFRAARGQRVCLFVDRLGGRTHYRDALMTGFGNRQLEVIEESNTRSAYRITESARICEVAFVTSGESHHFPVALASLYSKYIRELYMTAFNRYWSSRIAKIKPTAGYYTDARRWLDDAKSTLDEMHLDRSNLVRER